MKTILLILSMCLALGVMAQENTTSTGAVSDFGVSVSKHLNIGVFDNTGRIEHSIYQLTKDTLKERRPHIWYNDWTGELIDSSYWYKNIDQFIQLWDKFSKWCDDNPDVIGYEYQWGFVDHGNGLSYSAVRIYLKDEANDHGIFPAHAVIYDYGMGYWCESEKECADAYWNWYQTKYIPEQHYLDYTRNKSLYVHDYEKFEPITVSKNKNMEGFINYLKTIK